MAQHPAFPQNDTTKLTIGGGGEFEIKVRVPRWANQGVLVRINVQKQELKAEPGSFLTLSHTWKDGDRIELRMPFDFRLLPVMDQPDLASLFYGPVLLSGAGGGTAIHLAANHSER